MSFTPEPLINEQILSLVNVLADWADTVPAICQVILFGSRARGDHRFDSDVDIRVEFDYGTLQEDFKEWHIANCSDFADLKARLPGPLSLHQEHDDVALPLIRKAAEKPLLTLRKVICAATPPKH